MTCWTQATLFASSAVRYSTVKPYGKGEAVKVYDCTQAEIEKALRVTNLFFEGNLLFAKLEPHRHYCDVRLRVANSRGKGARRGYSGRRITSACWHAHGSFIDALPLATKVVTSLGTTYPDNAWQDTNIGSVMRPMMYSEACLCR